MDIRDELKQRRIFFDGGMGSMLQERGLLPGELPETWNLSHPEAVKEIHLEYLRAGADVVTANTFGANGFKYKKEEGYSLGSIVTSGVSLAKGGCKGGRTWICGSGSGAHRAASGPLRGPGFRGCM